MTTIDKELLEILVCPDCKADVKLDEEHQNIRDGIPIMLIEEAEEGDTDS